MTQQNHSYTAIFAPASEGGYVVSVPVLPGCLSQGETFEEAMLNIQDAITGYISVLKEDGDLIPIEATESVVARVTAPDPV